MLKKTCASFRHAKASHWIEDGLSIVEVQFLLGHEQIETTMKYRDGVPFLIEVHAAPEPLPEKTDSDPLEAVTQETEREKIRKKCMPSCHA